MSMTSGFVEWSPDFLVIERERVAEKMANEKFAQMVEAVRCWSVGGVAVDGRGQVVVQTPDLVKWRMTANDARRLAEILWRKAGEAEKV